MNNKYKELLPFIQANKQLLNSGNFKDLFDKYKTFSSGEYYTLTELLLEANIDPLSDTNMEAVENGFFMSLDITSVNIPNHISVIKTDAFNNCINLKDVTLP